MSIILKLGTTSFAKKLMVQKIRIIVILSLTFISCSLYGQKTDFGSIKGRIIDKDSKQPIVGALIILSNNQKSVSSDSLGFFEILKVKSGIHSIEIRLLGFETQFLNDINVLPNKTTFREISLQETIIALKGVQVKSFKYENNSVTPISSYSFSREEIALNPGSQGDIFRAIGMLPGVSSSGGIQQLL